MGASLFYNWRVKILPFAPGNSTGLMAICHGGEATQASTHVLYTSLIFRSYVP